MLVSRVSPHLAILAKIFDDYFGALDFNIAEKWIIAPLQEFWCQNIQRYRRIAKKSSECTLTLFNNISRRVLLQLFPVSQSQNRSRLNPEAAKRRNKRNRAAHKFFGC